MLLVVLVVVEVKCGGRNDLPTRGEEHPNGSFVHTQAGTGVMPLTLSWSDLTQGSSQGTAPF